MSLAEKIEKIKKEPEHIRLRYVWLCVFLSMFFVITLWIFSLQANNTVETDEIDGIMDLNSFGEELDQQKKILQQTTKSIQDSSEKIETETETDRVSDVAGEIELTETVEKEVEQNTKPNFFPGE